MPRILLAAGLHPFAVVPGGLARTLQDGGRRRRMLRGEGNRIGLERQQRAVRAADLELVVLAGLEPRHEQLPESPVLPQPHRVASAVPLVEITDDADATGIRGPDREAEAVDAVEAAELRPQDLVDEVGPDLAQGVHVVLLERRAEAIGVVAAALGPVPGLDLDLIERPADALDLRDPEAVRMATLERNRSAADDQGGGFRFRQDGADLPDSRRDLMRAQHAKGVAVIGCHHRRDRIGMDALRRGRWRGTGLGDIRGPVRVRRVGAGREGLVDGRHSGASLG